MKQFTNTYRVAISDEMKQKLTLLKVNYHIIPANFIRQAINEKLIRDIPKIRIKEERFKLPF